MQPQVVSGMIVTSACPSNKPLPKGTVNKLLREVVQSNKPNSLVSCKIGGWHYQAVAFGGKK